MPLAKPRPEPVRVPAVRVVVAHTYVRRDAREYRGPASAQRRLARPGAVIEQADVGVSNFALELRREAMHRDVHDARGARRLGDDRLDLRAMRPPVALKDRRALLLRQRARE